MRSSKRITFLWFEYERIGYVEQAWLFGRTVFMRCGSVRELFGVRWIKND